MSHFSSVAFKIYSLALVFNSLSIMCLDVYLFGLILLGVPWISLITILNTFHEIWGILIIISLNTLSFYLPLLCFWDYHYTYLDKFDSISQVSKGLLIFLQYFSLIIRLETSYWPCFRHIDPYAISNLLLSQWSKFFISVKN